MTTLRQHLDIVKSQLAPLERIDPPHGHLSAYLQHYYLHYAAEHWFGTFPSQGYQLVGHFFLTPQRGAGTVIVHHGYFDHVGILARLIRHLLEQGWAVAAFDTAGHGLSSGEPGDVTTFSTYTRILEDFHLLCQQHLPAPFHIVGFSMGGAVAVDSLLGPHRLFERAVLVGPLVRSAVWHLSKFGHMLSKGIVKKLPRAIRKSSSDKRFVDFLKRDPLEVREVPLTWVESLHDWEERIQLHEPVEQQLKVIQGTRDTTVDWRYNATFFRAKFPQVELHFIDSGRHQLLNEKRKLRERVFALVDEGLGVHD